MDPRYYNIIVFSLWFILPILPAFILYKFLPGNKISVKGPFNGLAVDMVGAFAGYFLLFAGSYILIPKLIIPLQSEFELWTVKVNVLDDSGRKLDKDKNLPEVILTPEPDIDEFKIAVKYNSVTGYYDFPGISFRASSSSDTMDLFLPVDKYADLIDPDHTKGEPKGKWKFDYDNRVLSYGAGVSLVKEELPSSNESNFEPEL